MSGPVDVLAWFDDYIRRCGIYDDGTPIRAAVAKLKNELEFLRDRLRNEVRAHQGRAHRLEGSQSVEDMVVQDLHTIYMTQLSGYADDLDAALANVGPQS